MERGFLSNTELRGTSGRLMYVCMIIVLLAIALITIFPFIFAFTSGLKGSTEIYRSGLNLLPEVAQWENYTRAWESFEMPRLFGNSFVIVGVGVFLRLLVCGAAAFSLSRLNPVGGRVISIGFLMTLMVPQIAYFVPLFTTITNIPIVNINLTNSYWGLWLPYCTDAVTIFLLKTFFDRIPQDLIDSARVDGATAWQLFQHIILPMSRSILIVSAVLSFVSLWRDFLLPFLVLSDPMTQPVTVRLFYVAEDYGANLQMAASFIALLPPLVVAIVMQRYMKTGLTLGGVKG